MYFISDHIKNMIAYVNTKPQKYSRRYITLIKFEIFVKGHYNANDKSSKTPMRNILLSIWVIITKIIIQITVYCFLNYIVFPFKIIYRILNKSSNSCSLSEIILLSKLTKIDLEKQ